MNRIPFGRGCCNRSSLVPDSPPHKQTLETENENVTVSYDFAFQQKVAVVVFSCFFILFLFFCGLFFGSILLC